MVVLFVLTVGTLDVDKISNIVIVLLLFIVLVCIYEVWPKKKQPFNKEKTLFSDRTLLETHVQAKLEEVSLELKDDDYIDSRQVITTVMEGKFLTEQVLSYFEELQNVRSRSVVSTKRIKQDFKTDRFIFWGVYLKSYTLESRHDPMVVQISFDVIDKLAVQK